MVGSAVPDADSLDPDRGLSSRDPVGTLLEVRGARIETSLYAFSVVLLEGRPCGPKARLTVHRLLEFRRLPGRCIDGGPTGGPPVWP